MPRMDEPEYYEELSSEEKRERERAYDRYMQRKEDEYIEEMGDEREGQACMACHGYGDIREWPSGGWKRCRSCKGKGHI